MSFDGPSVEGARGGAAQRARRTLPFLMRGALVRLAVAVMDALVLLLVVVVRLGDAADAVRT